MYIRIFIAFYREERTVSESILVNELDAVGETESAELFASEESRSADASDRFRDLYRFEVLTEREGV